MKSTVQQVPAGFPVGAVETGVVTLIGATTENPSFEVIRPCSPLPAVCAEIIGEGGFAGTAA